MSKKTNTQRLTSMFKGFRIPTGEKKPIVLSKSRIQYLLAQKSISYEDKILIESLREEMKPENFSKNYLDKIDTILGKEVYDACVDGKGDSWKRPSAPEVQEPAVDGEENLTSKEK